MLSRRDALRGAVLSLAALWLPMPRLPVVEETWQEAIINIEPVDTPFDGLFYIDDQGNQRMRYVKRPGTDITQFRWVPGMTWSHDQD